MDVLLQVNVSGEGQKMGCRPGDAEEILRAAARWPNIRIKGLMTIPPYDDDPEKSRPFFQKLVKLKKELEGLGIEGVSLDDISMGMSGDFEIAVEEGATLIRVGSAIFGARVY